MRTLLIHCGVLICLSVSAIDSEQVTIASRGMTATEYFDQLGHHRVFATTQDVTRLIAEQAHDAIGGNLYRTLTGWSDRFSTNWSYRFRDGGGFDVDNFIARKSANISLLQVEHLLTRFADIGETSLAGTIVANSVDLRGVDSSEVLDTMKAEVLEVGRITSGLTIEADAIIFNTHPVAPFAEGGEAVYTGVSPVAVGVTLGSLSQTNEEHVVILSQVVHDFPTYLTGTYPVSEGEIIFTYPTMGLRTGHVFRVSSSLLYRGVSDQKPLPHQEVAVSLVTNSTPVLTRTTYITGTNQIVELGPKYAIINMTHSTNPVPLRIRVTPPFDTGDSVVKVYPQIFLETLTGMEIH